MRPQKILIILVCVLSLGGCSWLGPKQPADNNPASNNPPAEQGDLKQGKINKFANLDELKTFLQENELDSDYYYSRGQMVEESFGVPTMSAGVDLGMEGSSESIADDKAIAPIANDFSTTNIQVAGVDESDIIKTDGNYIYALVKQDLYIIKAYPADQAEIISKIAFKSRPNDVYLNGDNLIIFGSDDNIRTTEAYKIFPNNPDFTFFKVFNIADKKNPKEVRDLNFEGYYSDSRMIGDYVYFVTTKYNYDYYNDEIPVLPRILEGGEAIANVCANGSNCLIPDMYYFDIPYDRYVFTNVYAINVANNEEDITSDVYLMSGNQEMYVSNDNMYITYTQYQSEEELAFQFMKDVIYPKLLEKDQSRLDKLEAVDSFILSDREKRAKIMSIFNNYVSALKDEERQAIENEVASKMKEKYPDISKELEKTIIHKIAIKDNNLEYKTFGQVTGHVLNQFSMDEDNSYFRIATTKDSGWSSITDESTPSYSNVYVLDENMKTVGRLENLAKDERIYSARFMQGRVYLVTFKQMDPFFAIDLSDPANPRVLGELKIPGFSDYLHPYDENTIIGFGKDTGETEWGGVRTKGLKLTLFDVADVSNPKEIDTYIMGDAGSDSIALYDHKAFLFSKEKDLISVPVVIRESLNNDSWGKMTFSGAAVVTVTKEGFNLKGRIDHSDGGQPSSEDYWWGYDYYDNNVLRSLYINDILYTFSNSYLMMNNLDDLSEVKKLELIKEGEEFEIIN